MSDHISRRDLDFIRECNPKAILALLDETHRLNGELAEARLSAEEAWDAHDEERP